MSLKYYFLLNVEIDYILQNFANSQFSFFVPIKFQDQLQSSTRFRDKIGTISRWII